MDENLVTTLPKTIPAIAAQYFTTEKGWKKQENGDFHLDLPPKCKEACGNYNVQQVRVSVIGTQTTDFSMSFGLLSPGLEILSPTFLEVDLKAASRGSDFKHTTHWYGEATNHSPVGGINEVQALENAGAIPKGTAQTWKSCVQDIQAALSKEPSSKGIGGVGTAADTRPLPSVERQIQ